jgi:hypothetical protein
MHQIATGKPVTANSCRRCLTAAHSSKDVMGILKGDWAACDGCAHQSVVRVLVEQFQKRAPRWWVVGGTQVVPIWIVEYLKRRREA